MKLKLFNVLVTVSAIFGIIIFMGSVGAVDYAAEVGSANSIAFYNMVLGASLTAPAIIRGVR